MRESLERGLGQAAAGEVEDLGSLAQYARPASWYILDEISNADLISYVIDAGLVDEILRRRADRS